MKDQAINILIVDDHQMLLEGVRSFVAGQFPNASILLASSHKEILGILNKRNIDVLLLDLILGNEDSRTFLSQLLQIQPEDRKSTRLNSSHVRISYAVFCLKKKKNTYHNNKLILS